MTMTIVRYNKTNLFNRRAWLEGCIGLENVGDDILINISAA